MNLVKWFKYYSIFAFKPYKEWKIVKEYFPKPRIKFVTDKSNNIWFFGMPIKASKFRLHWSNLGWKWKYDFVRHEWDPYIMLELFGRTYMLVWHYGKMINDTQDMCTWEAILDVAYNNKNIKDAISSNTWGSRIGEKSNDIEPIHK